MAALVIGSVSLDSVINSCISQLESVRFETGSVESNAQSVVKQALLHLRLCRWRHAVIKLIEAQDPGIAKAKGAIAKGKLTLIKERLNGEKRDKAVSADSLTAKSSGGWIVEALDTLAAKHRKPQGKPVPLLIRGEEDYDQLVNDLVDYLDDLEATKLSTELKTSLSRLRRDDANYIKQQPKANEHDIRALRETTVDVDEDLAHELVMAQGHQYHNNEFEGGEARMGDEVADGYAGRFIDNGNLYESNKVKDKAVVAFGNAYGKSVFDK